MANLVELGELWVCLELLGLVWFSWEGEGRLRRRKEEKEEGEEGRRRICGRVRRSNYCHPGSKRGPVRQFRRQVC